MQRPWGRKLSILEGLKGAYGVPHSSGEDVPHEAVGVFGGICPQDPSPSEALALS